MNNNFYKTESIDTHIIRIRDIANTSCYLICGERSSLLVDTGIGVGNLKELVDTLTDRPVTVLLTHGHLDHAQGAFGFPDVRMSSLDREIYLEGCDRKARLDYVKGAALMGGDAEQISMVTDHDLQPSLDWSQMLPLEPGEKFDLGGITVEVLEGAGHTLGSVTVLLQEPRILILGDACNNFTYLFDRRCLSVSEYLQVLLQLRSKVEGRYDRILLSHGKGDGQADMLDSVIFVCRQVLQGKSDRIPFQGFDGQVAWIAKEMDFQRFERKDGGSGNLVYNPERI